MSRGRSSDKISKQGHLSRKQCQEVNCNHLVQYQKAPGKFVQLTMYSVQLLSCALLFAIPWTAARHYVLNQNSHKKSPPTGQSGHCLIHSQRIWAAEDGGKREFFYTLSGGVNGCRNHRSRQGGSLSTKHPEPYGPTIPCLGSDPEKIRIHRDPCTLVFREAQLTTAKN